MLNFGYYNMDCMQGMKEFPDNYFDLAIVDPPYGDGGGTWTNGTRFGQRFDRYLEPGSGARHTQEETPKNWGGFKTLHVRSQEINSDLPGPAEHGRANSEKNHRVGYSAGKRIF